MAFRPQIFGSQMIPRVTSASRYTGSRPAPARTPSAGAKSAFAKRSRLYKNDSSIRAHFNLLLLLPWVGLDLGRCQFVGSDQGPALQLGMETCRSPGNHHAFFFLALSALGA